MSVSIGFIGSGNLTSALIKGLFNHHIDMSKIHVFDTDKEKSKSLQKIFKVQSHSSIDTLLSSVDMIVLSIKPQQYSEVITSISDLVTSQIIISPGAGMSINRIESLFSKPLKLIRVMPNTPASVNEGITGVTYNDQITKDDIQMFEQIFSHFGMISYIQESDFHSFTAIYGSGPAFVYMFIETLTSIAQDKLPNQKDQSYMIAKLLQGSSTLALQSTDSITTLRERVTSKGGVTIEGVKHIQQSTFHEILQEALTKAIDRSIEMSKSIL